jgi:ribA/ribD-fused uncharacterized protein
MTPDQRLADLCSAEAMGEQLDLLLFWGHKPTRSGVIGTGCLSQWWPAEFVVAGVSYSSAEHWMMAEKARLFGDAEGLAAVLRSASPGAAKAAGRTVRGFDEIRWGAARYDIVVAGNLAKFGQHPPLRDFLLATGRRILVEASPYDRIWGIGLAATDQQVGCPSRWRGLNLLGFALMDVREQLSSGPFAAGLASLTPRLLSTMRPPGRAEV